jgi:tetratricopeptide (TPR) repeat protein
VLAESVLNESQDSEMIRECHIILAYGYMKLNQSEKELFHIQRANAIERSETNLVRQAILLLKLARVEEAKALLESSLRFFPKNEQIKELLNRADQLPKK